VLRGGFGKDRETLDFIGVDLQDDATRQSPGKFQKCLKTLATPAGFEPATLSLEG
jgi:hypothetical protein